MDQTGLTVSGRQLVGAHLPSGSSIQERINELAVILAEAGLISDVVKFTCTGNRSAGVSQES